MGKNRLSFLLPLLMFLFCCSTTQSGPASSSNRGDNYIEEAQRHKDTGQRYLSQGAFLSAKKEFLIAAKLDNSDDTIWGLAGVAANRNGDYDEAIQYLNKAKQINPNDFRPYGIIGTIHKKMRRYEEAIIEFEKVRELNSADFKAPSHLADIYYVLRDYEKCEYYINEFEAKLSKANTEILTDAAKKDLEKTIMRFSNYRTVMSK